MAVCGQLNVRWKCCGLTGLPVWLGLFLGEVEYLVSASSLKGTVMIACPRDLSSKRSVNAYADRASFSANDLANRRKGSQIQA
jgi:hypothetical protein